MNLGPSFCCLACSNRFKVRDQEDTAQREARLATDRDHHALVRDLFTVYSQALVRRYNKGHHQSCSSFSIKVVVVWHGQIVFRCAIKKMLSTETSALPQIEIAMRWSEICFLFTTKLWSDDITRDIINIAHHSRSKLLLLGLVKSVSGARSRR